MGTKNYAGAQRIRMNPSTWRARSTVPGANAPTVLPFFRYVLEIKFFMIMRQASRARSLDFCDGKTAATPPKSRVLGGIAA